MRLCSRCKQEQDDSKFLKNQHWCKPCRAEYMREYDKQHASARKEKYKQNRDEILERGKQYRKNRYRNDPTFRLQVLLRVRLQQTISRIKHTKYRKLVSTLEGVGCTLLELKIHIESQFTEGMTWENHGNGVGRWNIDHIKPCSSFDITTEEGQLAMNHYSNLQPLWWEDNLVKSDNLEIL